MSAPNFPQANVNHSCDPNMSLLNWRNTNVAVANRPIEAGEQLFDTYGALYYHMKIDDRKAYVKVSSKQLNLPHSIARAQCSALQVLSFFDHPCPPWLNKALNKSEKCRNVVNGSPFHRSLLRDLMMK